MVLISKNWIQLEQKMKKLCLFILCIFVVSACKNDSLENIIIEAGNSSYSFPSSYLEKMYRPKKDNTDAIVAILSLEMPMMSPVDLRTGNEITSQTLRIALYKNKLSENVHNLGYWSQLESSKTSFLKNRSSSDFYKEIGLANLKYHASLNDQDYLVNADKTLLLRCPAPQNSLPTPMCSATYRIGHLDLKVRMNFKQAHLLTFSKTLNKIPPFLKTYETKQENQL